MEQSRQSEARHEPADERLANALGWFSIGLGLAEVVAPGGLARLIGIDDDARTRAVLRSYGLRELAAGAGILATDRPAGWLWSRVAGDMLDLSSLGKAMASSDNDRIRLGVAAAAVAGVTALDILCAQQLGSNAPYRWGASRDGRVRVAKTITINRTPEETYGFWRDFERLPEFMDHLEYVTVSGNRSHWKAKGPAGRTVEWDAEITQDEPNSLIAWRSLEGARVPNSGQVRFERAPGNRGTIVRVEIEYCPPGGAAAALAAKLFGEEPMQQLDDDLRHFKQIMEIGEVVRSDASVHTGMHAAQPPAERIPVPEPVMA